MRKGLVQHPLDSSSERHFLRVYSVYIFDKGMFHLPMGISSSRASAMKRNQGGSSTSEDGDDGVK